MTSLVAARRNSLLSLILLVGLLVPVPGAFGQSRARAKPIGVTKPAPPVRIPDTIPSDQLVNRTLPNGLEVIVLADHSVPLATVELAVKNGSYTEPPELNGLSHLYEHMFFKSNRAKVNQEAYLDDIDQQGIVYNGTTREEIVEYYFTTTSPFLPTAMRYMRDATLYPTFDQAEFEREREVVIGELDRHESNPGYFLEEAMNERLWWKYPSRKEPGGNKQTVATATTDMMRLIQGRYYVPNNSALIVTGDVNPDEVFRMAGELFSDWKRSDVDPFVKFPLVEHPPLPKSVSALVVKPDVENVVFELGWHGPSIGKDNPGTYAADVFSYILGQPNSRFQRALVDSGLVFNVGIGYYTQRNVGPINLVAQISPDNSRRAIKAIYNEISHFNDPNYFTDEELENAKTILAANDLFDREKLSDYSHTIGFWWASTGLDYFRGYQRNLRAISRADISRYIKRYIQNQPHVAVALVSEDAQRKLALKEDELLEQ
jgi:zinc protease